MEEWFDVVDRNDTVIGRASREEVHQNGLLHRSAHLLVFDGSGRVLLQKRSEGKDRFPGRWDSSVSGHVDSGEGYDQCIVREAMEEIGIRLEATREAVQDRCMRGDGPGVHLGLQDVLRRPVHSGRGGGLGNRMVHR